MKTILTAAKWPQRYGSLTKRFAAWLKDSHGCSYHGREMNLQAKVFCLSENEGGRIGDLHAFDSGAEYFAILMQLYVFSPNDFQKFATPEEARFARELFQTVFK